MADNKTRVTAASAQGYVAAIDDESRRKDCEALAKLMAKASQHPPKMWGSSIVGFGSYHYKYESGREGDWFRIGIASNASYISMYLGGGDGEGSFAEKFKEALPKAKIGRGCVRFKRLGDLDEASLQKMIRDVAAVAAKA